MNLLQEIPGYEKVEYLYDELSEYYHFLYPNIEDLNRRIASELDLKLLKPTNAKKILECACGTGHLAIELAKLGYEVTGLDLSKQMLRQAMSNAKRASVDIKFIHSNILSLSTTIEDKYDVVICRGNSFSHIRPNDLEMAFENFNFVLKKGGICYVDIRNYEIELCEKPLFEHRAHLKVDEKDIISFYIFDYKEDIRTYNIFFVFFNKNTKAVSHKLVTIDGFIVFENTLLDAFKASGFEDIKKINIDGESKEINIYLGTKA